MNEIRFPERIGLPWLSEEEAADFGAESLCRKKRGIVLFNKRYRYAKTSHQPVLTDLLDTDLSDRNHQPCSVEVSAQTLHQQRADAQELLQQSFWQVWLQHSDYLKKRSYHFLNHQRDEAEDAMSTTMLKAQNNFIKSSGSINNIRAWLTTILHNACMDGHRNIKRSKEVFIGSELLDFENLASQEVGRAQTPEELVDIQESLEVLYCRILELPAALREPLLLRAIEHLSYSEIAQQLELTEVNVRKRVQQARGRLRDAQ